jgi:hypothetical protein
MISQITAFVTSPDFYINVKHFCEVATIAISLCSAISNYLPKSEEETANKVLFKVSKIINFIALNIKK